MNNESNVIFIPIDPSKENQNKSEKAVQVLRQVLETEDMALEPYVPLKVHFGEEGNNTYIRSDNYSGIVGFLESNKIESAYIETNALYKGQRQNRTSHLLLAEDHGFIQLPVIIADGEYGDKFAEIKGEGKHFDKLLIAKGIADLNQMIVLAHFKGHMLAGFGGAIKQLAMGCASRGGKLAQHANAIPKFKPRKCDACGECLEVCPGDAIILDPKPLIEESKCLGCASCIAVCKKGCMSFTWWASIGKKFRERIAEYAFAAQKDKKNIYLNFLLSITSRCDCESRKLKPIVPDIGILGSVDPVAIDSASLDLVQKNKGRKVFQRGRLTLEYAQEIGLGNMSYNLIQI